MKMPMWWKNLMVFIWGLSFGSNVAAYAMGGELTPLIWSIGSAIMLAWSIAFIEGEKK